MLQQQVQRGGVVEIERAVDRVAPGDASAVLQQQARARRILQRVVKRFVVIGIGAGFEQQSGQRRVVVASGGAVERRQWIALVGLASRDAGGQRLSMLLVGVGAGREQQLRAPMQAIAKLRHAQQARMRDGEKRRQSQRAARPIEP